jgi:hypothetical protein
VLEPRTGWLPQPAIVIPTKTAAATQRVSLAMSAEPGMAQA